MEKLNSKFLAVAAAAVSLHAALLLASQGHRGQEFNHPLTAFQSAQPQKALSVGTVNVLAIMVQFQADSDTLTSGNGQFVMTPDSGLDAGPHDKTYFENHLLFLKNYFYKASGGKLNINYTVLDSVITLPHQMKYYSPPDVGTTSANNLGLLYQDAWHAADSIYKNFDFSQFQCFVIFHAGSGRDIDFTSTLGYDPLPYDIPSLYLNMQTLRSMFGASYDGQPVDGGNFSIPNSIIMPESETYPIIDLTLGTNGLLAASFGSFLGLPDLFDTQTGVTGIGRFGLMDGQSIFAYGGIFPPEPSAWEKMYLGWVKPIDASPSTATTYQLYANETGRYSVLKVPISGSEYFLVENRERDARHNGEVVTTFYNGNYSTVNMTLAQDTAYFDGTQIKGINGVVTDADEFDWALPEPDYPPDRATYYGGVLIWHIDQNVIDANIATNTINADPAHRGVTLMEAHGANMIGFLIQDITGSYYYDGTVYDFWFRGNPIPTYGNQFTPASLPNSNSYSGANSHVYITNFSSADSVMTVDVRVGDSNIQPTAGFPRNIYGATVNSSPVFGHISADGRLQMIANNGDSLYAFNMDGTSAGFDSAGLFSRDGGAFQPVVSSENVSSNTLYAMDDSVLYGFVDKDNIVRGTADTVFAIRLPSGSSPAYGPLLVLGNKIVSTMKDYPDLLSIFSLSGGFIGQERVPLVVQLPASAPIAGSAVGQQNSPSLARFAAIDTSNMYLNIPGSGVYTVNIDKLIQSGSNYPSALTTLVGPPNTVSISYASLSSGRSSCIVEMLRNSVYIDSINAAPHEIFSTLPGDTIVSGPVIADLNGDSNRDIIFGTQTKIYAVSYTGAVLDHFPLATVGSEVLPSDANRIVGSIVVADLDGDGKPEVIFGTKGGDIYAFTGATGQLLTGFPLSIGGGLAGSPAVAYDPSGNLYLAAIGLDGYLYSWTFRGTSASQVVWGSLLYDNCHLNAATEPLEVQSPPVTQDLMPTSEVYNWPNPVTGGLTKIHFYLRDNARVSISIFTFAGDKVADIQANGVGGMANEVDWNASGVQSGVYFARVEAVSSKGRAVAIIKIAVVK